MDPQNISSQPQPFEQHVNQLPTPPYRLPLIIGTILFLVIIGVGGAYYLGTKQSTKIPVTVTPTQIPKVIAIPTSLTQPTQTLIIPSETASWSQFKTATFLLKLPPRYTAIEVANDQYMITTDSKTSISAITITGANSDKTGKYDETIDLARKSEKYQEKSLNNGVEYMSLDKTTADLERSATFKYNDNAIFFNLVTDGSDKSILENFDLMMLTVESRDRNPEYCTPNQEYQSDYAHPLTCICPKSYKFQQVSLTQTKCSDKTGGDCPIMTRKCSSL